VLKTSVKKSIVMVLLMMVVGGAIRVDATSFDPLPRKEEPAAPAMAPGDTVFLFHSGTREVLGLLKPGDVLGVFRTLPDGTSRPVGTIRAAAFVGEFCLKGEVTDGKILPQDVAEKDRVYLLVTAQALCR
jgi:hypothetical protein